MLVQITDPSAPKSDGPVKLAIGIDFGTTHCVAGIVLDNRVKLIPIEENSSVLLPSIISYQDQQPTVGVKAAQNLDAIYSIKRVMGRSAEEVQTISERQIFSFIHTEQGLKIKTLAGLKHPITIAENIFRHIKNQAESYLNQDINDAVVTVPAYFDEAARSSIKDAAKLAGLNVLRLVAEPTAAALAYGLDDEKEGVYIVYDLGGGTFDVSVLRMTQGVFQVLATGGDAFLGGDDIDSLIVDHFIKDTILTADQRRQALLNARHVKERLSTQLKATFDTPLGDRCVLKRDIFDSIIEPIIDRTLKITMDVLNQSGASTNQIQGSILVGGATRIPKIHTALSERLEVPIFQSLNPDEVVAMGAARQAHLLTQGGDSLLVDVTPLSLGVEMMGGIVDKIILRNSPIPIRKAQDFTTFQDNQTGIVIHVVQGEREIANDCRSLGRFVLSGIPMMPAGMVKIQVVFALDADGLLTVSAVEENTGIAQKIIVKPTYGLDEETMAEMILDSHRQAQTDMENRLLTQAQLKGKQITDVIEKALINDSELLPEAHIDLIQKELQALRQLLLTDNRASIEASIDKLNSLTTEFAQLRMQKYLKSKQ